MAAATQPFTAVTCFYHTHLFNGPLSRTTRVSRCKKGKPIWILLKQETVSGSGIHSRHMQVCTSLQSDNHASTPPLSFLEAGCPSCRPTNSVKALKAMCFYRWQQINEVRQETVRQWAAAVAVRCTRARQHQCWQCEAEPQRVADVGS